MKRELVTTSVPAMMVTARLALVEGSSESWSSRLMAVMPCIGVRSSGTVNTNSISFMYYIYIYIH
jgi:hypothetical protein